MELPLGCFSPQMGTAGGRSATYCGVNLTLPTTCTVSATSWLAPSLCCADWRCAEQQQGSGVPCTGGPPQKALLDLQRNVDVTLFFKLFSHKSHGVRLVWIIWPSSKTMRLALQAEGLRVVGSTLLTFYMTCKTSSGKKDSGHKNITRGTVKQAQRTI